MGSEKEVHPCLEGAMKKLIDDMEKSGKLEPGKGIIGFFSRIKKLHEKGPAHQKEPLRLLDVGAGEGTYANMLKFILEGAVDITGIDLPGNHKPHDHIMNGVLTYVQADCMHYIPEEKYDIVFSNFLMEPMGVRNSIEVSPSDERFLKLARRRIKALKRKSIEFAKPGGIIFHVTDLPVKMESVKHPKIPTKTIYSGPRMLIERRMRKIKRG